MSVTDYIARLNRDLAGRVPKRLVRPLLGSIVFVLTDPTGAKQRFTVRFDDEGAEALAGVHESPDRPSALVRGPLEAWMAFFHDAKVERMGELGFYGETGLLETLAALLALKLSPLAMRVNAGKPRDT